jgi:hypothetical protein
VGEADDLAHGRFLLVGGGVVGQGVSGGPAALFQVVIKWVLTIVEHDQQLPRTKLLGERVGQRLFGSLEDAHDPTNRRCDQPGLTHLLQVHPIGPIGKTATPRP